MNSVLKILIICYFSEIFFYFYDLHFLLLLATIPFLLLVYSSCNFVKCLFLLAFCLNLEQLLLAKLRMNGKLYFMIYKSSHICLHFCLCISNKRLHFCYVENFSTSSSCIFSVFITFYISD